MFDLPRDPAGRPDDRTADRLAIARTVNRFEDAFDAGDLDAHMATWAEQMTFTSPFGNFSDRPSYANWVKGFIAWTRANLGGTRHLITNTDISFTGPDDAQCMSYLTIFGRKGATVAATSVCLDTFRRIDSTWLITARDLVVDQEFKIDS